MQIKTINKRIRDTRDEIDFILAEFKIKLDRFLRTLDTFAYADVSCYSVKIRSDDILSVDDIKKIENEFMLELQDYDVTYNSPDFVVEVWYRFDYAK